jgi:hypothetical protein
MAAPHLLDGFELLMDAPMARRGKVMLQALADTAAPGRAELTRAYRGGRRTLVVYGAGLPARRHAVHQHRRQGGRVVFWDLGYWDRDAAMRLAIDTLHPSAAQLAASPAAARRTHRLRSDAKAGGPVVLVGVGLKSCELYGLRPLEWERRTLQRLLAEQPQRPVRWRPKGRDVVHLPGAQTSAGGAIDDVLRGASLVVCRHSNVAIDACIAGVPVQCEDGAALALYQDNPEPTPEQRADFLARLSWWNWFPAEARAAWQFIETHTA